MSKNKSVFSSALALVLIFALFTAALLGVNVFAAPMIESNGSAQLLAPLYEVMPDAAGFELLYDAADPAASALADVPETVRSIYAETSGAGYALTLSTTEGYTGAPMEIAMAVDGEGKISGIAVSSYPDSKDIGRDYPATYLGTDSALGGVSLVAGVTYSSRAFMGAVGDGFAALVGNGLIGAGVKSDSQLLAELLVSVYPGIANSEGVAQYEETAVEGAAYIRTAMVAANGGGVAYIAADGETSCLAICNLGGSCLVYDVNGADITDSVPAALIDEAKADAALRLTSLEAEDVKLLGDLAGEGAELTALPTDGVFGSVTGAYLITDGEARYYGFVSRPYGYSNLPLTVAYVLDGSGAIYAMKADELILMGEYFTAYELDKNAYEQGFAGLTQDSLSGEEALISGATVTSEAVAVAVRDVFDAFAAVSQNGGES